MPRKRKGSGSKSAKRRAATPIAEAPPVKEGAPLAGRVTERPDGFYWEAKKGEPHGPFPTLAEAEADMLADGAAEDDDLEAGALQEAESDLGVAEWIDPDTGGPAEDHVPRIEDH